ncbi:MAG: hypothetical protein QOC75_3613, partial [Pseudonocardiales bacterium]|nr:hypothetical protein [Pseudonocardiales bacterium]
IAANAPDMLAAAVPAPTAEAATTANAERGDRGAGTPCLRGAGIARGERIGLSAPGAGGSGG